MITRLSEIADIIREKSVALKLGRHPSLGANESRDFTPPPGTPLELYQETPFNPGRPVNTIDNPNVGPNYYSSQKLNTRRDLLQFNLKCNLFGLELDQYEDVTIGNVICNSTEPGDKTYEQFYADVFNDNKLEKGINLIGSLLTGNGINVSGNRKGFGLDTNFDLKQSILYRTLGANSIKDTPLGIVGAKELKKALLLNVLENATDLTVDRLNVSIFDPNSVFRGGPLIKPDFKISKNDNFIIDYASRLLGINRLKSPISDDEGSLFNFGAKPFNYVTPDINTESRNFGYNGILLKYTGKGQKGILNNLLNKNIYSAGKAEFDDKSIQLDTVPYIDSNNNQDRYSPVGLNFDNDVNNNIPSEFVERVNVLDRSFPDKPAITPNGLRNGIGAAEDLFDSNSIEVSSEFYWKNIDKELENSDTRSQQFNERPSFGNTKSLLHKTEYFYRLGKIRDLGENYDGEFLTSVKTSVLQGQPKGQFFSGQELSAGRGIRSPRGTKITLLKDNDFCRVWSPRHKYRFLSSAVRSSGLFNKISFGTPGDSVLDPNGLVRMAPYTRNGIESEELTIDGSAKRYMFSLENLAWRLNLNDLPTWERGPGDPENSNIRGRIMWFPPYDLKFSENSKANWSSEVFLGRGEPVYTYNNSERTANISFKVLVDHSTFTNQIDWKKVDDNVKNAEANNHESIYRLYEKFNAGCVDETEIEQYLRFIPDEIKLINKPLPKPQFRDLPKYPTSQLEFKIFFPNDCDTLDANFKMVSGVNTPPKRNVEISGGENMYDYFSGFKTTKSKFYPSYDFYGDKEFSPYVGDVKRYGGGSDGTKMMGFIASIVTAGELEKDKDTGKVYSFKQGNTPQVINENLKKTTLNQFAYNFLNFGKNFKDPKKLSPEEVDKVKLFTEIFSDPDVEIDFEIVGSASLVTRFNTKIKETSDGKNFDTTISNKFSLGEIADTFNLGLATARARYLESKFNDFINSLPTRAKFKNSSTKISTDFYKTGDSFESTDKSEDTANKNRAASLKFTVRNIPRKPDPTYLKEEKIYLESLKGGSVKIKRRFVNEAKYFTFLEKNDSMVYNNIKSKIKYFNPAFHSVTPEGLNSRLNFLQQCLRQGPGIDNVSDVTDINFKKENSVFGPPPVCILRLGDFFNCKVIIDDLQINYDDTQWDMNPEGIGLQPMIANVSLSLRMIGGHSISGPLNKLQNAVSFNYYANTQFYDLRSDSFDGSFGKYELRPGLKYNNDIKDFVIKVPEGTTSIEDIKDLYTNDENTGTTTIPKEDMSDDTTPKVIAGSVSSDALPVPPIKTDVTPPVVNPFGSLSDMDDGSLDTDTTPGVLPDDINDAESRFSSGATFI